MDAVRRHLKSWRWWCRMPCDIRKGVTLPRAPYNTTLSSFWCWPESDDTPRANVSTISSMYGSALLCFPQLTTAAVSILVSRSPMLQASLMLTFSGPGLKEQQVVGAILGSITATTVVLRPEHVGLELYAADPAAIGESEWELQVIPSVPVSICEEALRHAVTSHLEHAYSGSVAFVINTLRHRVFLGTCGTQSLSAPAIRTWLAEVGVQEAMAGELAGQWCWESHDLLGECLRAQTCICGK